MALALTTENLVASETGWTMPKSGRATLAIFGLALPQILTVFLFPEVKDTTWSFNNNLKN